MKYFNNGEYLLSDFDGVFLDSQERHNKIMKEKTDLESWMKYLNSINWYNFLRECNEIPGATETFLELQQLKILKGFITRIHSFEEGKEKSLKLVKNRDFMNALGKSTKLAPHDRVKKTKKCYFKRSRIICSNLLCFTRATKEYGL